MKIVVLCGGLSTERNISFLSGTKVCRALRARGHQAVLVDLFMGLEDETREPAELFEDLPELKPLTFDGTAEELFMGLRIVGMDAEQAMYAATGGVNTHKGIIFTFGIFCAAAGRCLRENHRITATNLLGIEQAMTVRVLTAELEKLKGITGTTELSTHGERNLRRYGTAGCRGEAIEGYPGVFGIALPVLREGIRQRREWNSIKLQALLTLMANTEDSNILSRQNPAVLRDVQQEMQEFLRYGGAYRKDAIKLLEEMDGDYTRRNISAGGCADLLATAIFILELERGAGSDRLLVKG